MSSYLCAGTYLTDVPRLPHYCAAMKAFLKAYGPAIASGVLLALAFPSWSLFPLAWVALAPVLYQARGLTPRACAGRFFLAGWVFYSLLLHWLMTNVYWAGGWAFWGYQFLCVYLALYWAAAGCAWSLLRYRGLFLLWPCMELVQGRLLSGFGWGAIGYSQGKDLLILQLASLGNVVIISAIVVLVNEYIAFSIPRLVGRNVDKPRSKSNPKSRIQNPKHTFSLVALFLGIIVLIASHAAGLFLLGQPDYKTKPFSVGIIQTDFPLEMKWDPEYSEEMVRNAAEKSRELAQHEKVNLFLWPEATVMDEIAKPGIAREVASLSRETGAALFTGAQRRNEKTGGYPNSSFLIDKEGKVVDFYDKVHLVAFGEYVPFGDYFPFIQKVVPAIGDVEAGDKQKVLSVGGEKFGPLICFEVLFRNLAMNLRETGASFLVVITNLGWFGSSAAIPQELEIARMRAVETRLPLAHCSNTGISGVFDPWGRFTMIDAHIAPDGTYYKLNGRLAPAQTVMQRLVGALPVPAPASRLLPPALAQGALIAATAAMILLATFQRIAGSRKR